MPLEVAVVHWVFYCFSVMAVEMVFVLAGEVQIPGEVPEDYPVPDEVAWEEV